MIAAGIRQGLLQQPYQYKITTGPANDPVEAHEEPAQPSKPFVPPVIPDRPNTLERFAGEVLSVGLDSVNGGLGIEPNLSALVAVTTAATAFTDTGAIPASASGFFNNHLYAGYRMAAPFLDALKLVNTYKMSAALGHQADPKVSGLRAVAKSGRLFNLAVDAGHLALDVAVVGAYVGAALNIPALAFMTPEVAGSIGFAGDVVAAAVHSVGAATALSNPANGATLGRRWQRLINTQGLTAMVERVFMNKEPLNTPIPPFPNLPENPRSNAPAAPAVVAPMSIPIQPLEVQNLQAAH